MASELRKELRRDPRLESEGLIRFEGDDFEIYSRIRDQSRYGLFVTTNYLLEEGTKLKVFLKDNDGNEAMTLARVVHATTPKAFEGEAVLGLGLEFIPNPQVFADAEAQEPAVAISG